MNNNEKKFLVTKIEKYNEEKDKVMDGMKKNLFSLGVSALLLFFAINKDYNHSSEITEYLYNAGLGIYGLANIFVFKNFIKGFVDKIGLSHRIDEINEIIHEFNQSDEKRGKAL